ncbi:AMED_5909 family protein [Kutzneria chonburiensis]|uniref:AMED_5909 family protein n=1 Tax=Kutzneria chonburiensis TaxID=1483604 RepID=A0ABV6MK25_9PSEU|nr:AMED_5909 family protein [Kutzneria chonburiensis]
MAAGPDPVRDAVLALLADMPPAFAPAEQTLAWLRRKASVLAELAEVDVPYAAEAAELAEFARQRAEQFAARHGIADPTDTEGSDP